MKSRTWALQNCFKVFFALLLFLFSAQAWANNKITIGLPASVNTLDPHKTATVGTDLSVISHLYTPLIIRGTDLKLAPSFATSWKAVNDLTWQFELRKGITFPNGEKLDAATVKWNIERILNPEFKARIKAWFEPISEINVLSETQVEIKTKEAYPALPSQLSVLFLLPPKWSATHDIAREALGTGPYDLVEFRSGDQIVIKAKPNYWGAAPDFTEAVFRPVPEIASRVSGILSGDLDIAIGVPPAEIDMLNKNDKITAGAVPSTRMMFIKFNTLVAPFKDNATLRQALNYAVDKKALIEYVLAGLVPEAKGQILMEGYFGFNPKLDPYPYDPQKAKTLLAQAGYPSGLKVELEIPIGRYLLAQEIGQAVAAMLESAGVQVQIKEMQFGPWLTKYRKAGQLGQMAYLGQAWSTLDADGLLTLFEPGNKYAYWNDEVFGRLLKEARTTTNPQKREALYAKATQRMRDEAPVIFLFNQPITYAVSKAIVWKARSDDWVRIFDMRKAK